MYDKPIKTLLVHSGRVVCIPVCVATEYLVHGHSVASSQFKQGSVRPITLLLNICYSWLWMSSNALCNN